MSVDNGPFKPTVKARIEKNQRTIKGIDNQILRKEEAHQKEIALLKNLRAQAELSISTLQAALINDDKLQHMQQALTK